MKLMDSLSPRLPPSSCPSHPPGEEDSTLTPPSLDSQSHANCSEKYFPGPGPMPLLAHFPPFHNYPGPGLGSRSFFQPKSSTNDERKLFVGGLPPTVTDQDFRAFFEQFGELLDSVVVVDKSTRRPRGFGFVKFADIDVARKMLTMGCQDEDANFGFVGRLEMHGKMVEMKLAQPRPEESVSSSITSSVSAVEAQYFAPAYLPLPPQYFYPMAVDTWYQAYDPYTLELTQSHPQEVVQPSDTYFYMP